MDRSEGVPEFDCPGRSSDIPMVRVVGGAELAKRLVIKVEVGNWRLSSKWVARIELDSSARPRRPTKWEESRSFST